MKKSELYLRLALLVNQRLYDEDIISYNMYSGTLKNIMDGIKMHGSI